MSLNLFSETRGGQSFCLTEASLSFNESEWEASRR